MADYSSIFNSIKTKEDFDRADIANQIAGQQLQTGAIDAATKRNAYATQLLAGATAGNSQASYDQARQQLAQSGFDMSSYAPDVQTAAQQVQAARLAQSPLGSLLGLGLKAESGLNTAAGLTGNTNTAGAIAPIAQGLKNAIGGVTGLSSPQAAGNIDTVLNATGNLPARADAENIPAGNIPLANSYDKTVAPSARFNPPRQEPGETIQSYNTRLEQAFKSYKEDPNTIADQESAKTRATKTATEEVDRRANFTKAESSLKGFEQQANLMTNTIDRALGAINKPYSAATGYGQLLSGLPNSDAGELNNYLATIKANVGFDKLQNMRDNSPTGGALGNVSENENKLLQAVNGALDPTQREQLKDNLNLIKSLYPQVLSEKQRAFQQDYGSFTPIGAQPSTAQVAPPQTAATPAYKNGMIADGPNGESLVYMDGKWRKK